MKPLYLVAAIILGAICSSSVQAESSSKEACMVEFLREAKQRAMQSVEPEYNRRLNRDGKAKADRWLARTAREIGIRDGKAARKACGQ